MFPLFLFNVPFTQFTFHQFYFPLMDPIIFMFTLVIFTFPLLFHVPINSKHVSGKNSRAPQKTNLISVECENSGRIREKGNMVNGKVNRCNGKVNRTNGELNKRNGTVNSE